MKGGERKGAGRPKGTTGAYKEDSEKLKNRSFKLSDAQHQKVMQNGGAKWIRELIDNN